MNNDTHNYYMVLVRLKENLEADPIVDYIYSTKKKALSEAKKYKGLKEYKVEILKYTGTSDDQLRNFWGAISI